MVGSDTYFMLRWNYSGNPPQGDFANGVLNR